MTDLDKIELALRRTADYYKTSGTHDHDLIADAFDNLADAICKIIADHAGEP